VKVPAGVDTGTRLRLRGEGEGGYRGGLAGDLYVRIGVQHHEFFERDGDNLFAKVPVSFVQAILGDRIEIPTLEGTKTLEIQPGTQPGSIVRFTGEGVPRLRGRGRGDLFIEVEVRIPKSISARQDELLREFMELDRDKTGSKVKKWPWNRKKNQQEDAMTDAARELHS
jgi:molecular chaperone DnaJ